MNLLHHQVQFVSPLAKTIGRNIQQVRKAQGLSQEKLAHLAGLDRSYMSRIERGIVSVTVEKLYRVAAILGCMPHELLPAPSEVA